MEKMGNILYDNTEHQCIHFSFDEEEYEDRFLSVNQYLIIHKGKGILLDPGSAIALEPLLEAVQHYISLDKIGLIFLSHQDPDVAGAILQWSHYTPAKIIISKLWTRFLSHYGIVDTSRLIPLEDQGATIHLSSDAFIRFVPAHFLHSPGNFSLYDSLSGTLFSGDIGAAITTHQEPIESLEMFETLRPSLEAFHQRYMAGNAYARAWVKQVRQLPTKPQCIAPQHGVAFKGVCVEAFLDWFETLACGGEHIEDLYAGA